MADELSADDRRRAQLEAFIARSERAKRVTVIIGATCLALAGVLVIIGLGGFALAAAALGGFVAATGLWISGGHIRDFQGELRALDARRRRAEP